MKPALWAEAHRLREIEKLSISQIARQLNCSRYLVRRALDSEQPPAPESTAKPKRLIDPFKEQIERILEKHPKLSAVRILEKIAKPDGERPGYRGGITQLRIYLKSVRPKPARVYHDVHYDPGEAMQIDWGDVGMIRFGKAQRRVSVFVAVLCHSRMIYIHFTLSQRKHEFYRSIVQALNFFGGSPRKIIFDNLKAAVIGGSGRNAVLHPEFAALCGTYLMEPIACEARDPESKGRVENGVKYVKRNALAGRDEELQAWDDYRHLAIDWRDRVANVRLLDRIGQTPQERFLVEKPALRQLPSHGYNTDEFAITQVRSTAHIEFDCNRYSVPPKFARQTVTVIANARTIRILHASVQIAEHHRSYGKREKIVDPQHQLESLQMRNRRKLSEAEEQFGALGEVAVKFRLALSKLPTRPAVHLKRILSLVRLYGREAVLQAMRVALEYSTIDAAYVESLVLQERRKSAMPSPLPLQPKRKDLIQLELDLPDPGRYDRLLEEDLTDDQSQA